MRDSEHLVGVVERALRLRTVPYFVDATPDQLASLAEHMDELFFPPGSTLFRSGEAPDRVYFILDGTVRLDGGVSPRHVRAGEALGAPAVLELEPRFYTAVVETETSALSLRAEDLFDVLEDDFDLARVVIRTITRRIRRLRSELGMSPDSAEPEAFAPFCTECETPLNMLQRIVFLRSVPQFADATIDELARLAAEVAEVRLQPGQVLFSAGDLPEAFYLILRGRIGQLGPRSLVGGLASIANTPYDKTVAASEFSHLLRVPAESLFDLLEDHFDMTQRILRQLSCMARSLEDAVVQHLAVRPHALERVP